MAGIELYHDCHLHCKDYTLLLMMTLVQLYNLKEVDPHIHKDIANRYIVNINTIPVKH